MKIITSFSLKAITLILFFQKVYSFKNQLLLNQNSLDDQLFFIENKGQWDKDIFYLCRMKGADVWITSYGLNFTFYRKDNHTISILNAEHANNGGEYEKNKITGQRIMMKFIDLNKKLTIFGKNKKEFYYNYFIGNNLKNHVTNVNLYREVIIKNIYDGIDLKYYFSDGYLRYDFIVNEGANPSDIKFKFDGHFKSYLKNKKNICLTTIFGEINISDLRIIQEGKEIESAFDLENNIWQIRIGKYNPQKKLIIDPLVYSTFIGGAMSEFGYALKTDGSGNTYLTGSSESINYDLTPGVFQLSNAGLEDLVVTKLNSSGSGLIYSTFIGGSGVDRGWDIKLDINGNAYVVGTTTSNDFPVTSMAFQSSFGGIRDVVVLKINNSGNALLYSTYVGGTNDDFGNALFVNGIGEVYFVGRTESNDYPVASSFQSNYSGNTDAFISKLSINGNVLLYSSYLGGNSYDEAKDIQLDMNGNIYIVGETNSFDFPITSGAFQTILSGHDAFICKLNPSGNTLVYCTYIGGNGGGTVGESIIVDLAGNVIITGTTFSPNFPVTPGAFQAALSGGKDIFALKLNSLGSNLIFSTYIGGSNDDVGISLVTDNVGNFYITGVTQSNDFPITSNAFQSTISGSHDVIFFIINSSGTQLFYSTYLGGPFIDQGMDIDIDNISDIYLTGSSSLNYPTTPGSFQTSNDGFFDIFVTKFCNLFITPTSTLISANQTVCTNNPISNINFFTLGASGSTVSGLPPGVTSNFNNGIISITGSPNIPGNFSYTITVTGNCIITQTGNITVIPSPTLNVNVTPSVICEGNSVSLTVSGAVTYTISGPGGFYSNNSSTTITNILPASSGQFTFSGTSGICSTNSYVLINVNANPQPTIVSNNLLCSGQTLSLHAFPNGMSTYLWSGPQGFSSTIQNSYINNVSLNNGGIYTLNVVSSQGCTGSSTMFVTVNQSPTLFTSSVGTITCSNGSSNLIANSSNSNVVFSWSGPGIVSGANSGTVLVNQTGIYQVVGTNTLNGCVGISTLSVPTNTTPPSVGIFVGGVLNCLSPTVIVTSSVHPSAGITYSWSGPGIVGSGSTSSISVNLPGVYQLTVLNSVNGCSSTVHGSVLQNTSAPALILTAQNQSVCLGETLTLDVKPDGMMSYSWSGPQGFFSSLQKPIIHNINNENSGIYSVTVTGTNGCSSTGTLEIYVENCDFFVYIPNAFSPNGDGRNDFLRIFGKGIDEIHFEIYNRWGNKVFESDDINKAWDGTYKGEIQNSNVYVYILSVKFLNGQTIKKSGDITLLK